MSFKVPDQPHRLLLALQEGYCNLKCPMCYVHSPSSTVKVRKGTMDYDGMVALLDRFDDPKPSIGPATWAEPLMLPEFDKYLTAMKERGFPVNINTNGLLLTDRLAELIVALEVESVFVSVDAHTPEVLQQVRGTSKLDEVHAAVHRLLKARGSRTAPRIGVSFLMQEGNERQRDEFIAHWTQYVDAVRINERLDQNSTQRHIDLPPRIPCGYLYDTLTVNHEGDAVICCLDAQSDYVIGNVFKQDWREIWHGKALNAFRARHEAGEFGKIPLCANCEAWAGYEMRERIEGDILIRASATTSHYNRIDRMGSWERDQYDKRYEK